MKIYEMLYNAVVTSINQMLKIISTFITQTVICLPTVQGSPKATLEFLL